MRILFVLPVLAMLAVPSSASGAAADDFGPRQTVLETPWFIFY